MVQVNAAQTSSKEIRRPWKESVKSVLDSLKKAVEEVQVNENAIANSKCRLEEAQKILADQRLYNNDHESVKLSFQEREKEIVRKRSLHYNQLQSRSKRQRAHGMITRTTDTSTATNGLELPNSIESSLQSVYDSLVALEDVESQLELYNIEVTEYNKLKRDLKNAEADVASIDNDLKGEISKREELKNNLESVEKRHATTTGGK